MLFKSFEIVNSFQKWLFIRQLHNHNSEIKRIMAIILFPHSNLKTLNRNLVRQFHFISTKFNCYLKAHTHKKGKEKRLLRTAQKTNGVSIRKSLNHCFCVCLKNPSILNKMLRRKAVRVSCTQFST